MALALNRYLCTSVLPLLMKHSHYFRESEHASVLLETMLQTCYRLSKCRTLTKGQQEMVSDFLVSFTQYVHVSVKFRSLCQFVFLLTVLLLTVIMWICVNILFYQTVIWTRCFGVSHLPDMLFIVKDIFFLKTNIGYQFLQSGQLEHVCTNQSRSYSIHL